MKYKLLFSFINTVIVILPFTIIFSDYKPNKTKVLIIGIVYSLLYFLDIYFLTLPLWISEIILFVITYLFIQTIYSFNHKLIITIASIFFILNNLVIIISSPLNELINYNIYLLSLALIKIISVYILAKWLKSFDEAYSPKILQRSIITILPLIVVFEFLYIQFILNNNLELDIIIICYCISIGLVFILIKKYFVNEEKLTQAQLKNLNNQKIINENHQYESDRDKFRQERHDLIAKLTTIKVEIEDDKKDVAIKYLNELTKNVSNRHDKVFSPVKEIDNLLNIKSSNRDIKLNYESNVFSIPDKMVMDIVVILSNLIDNAIDEIRRMNIDHPEIKINLNHNDHTYAILVENSLTNKKNLLSEKEDKDNHGYGLKIVKETVEKYHGVINIEQDQYFIVRIVLFENETA